MNQLTTLSNQATMSSREIAELTGKEHANVLRDIRNMLDALGKDAFNFEGIYLDAYGREKPCMHIDRELTLTLVSGYDTLLRHRVVTRLSELEAKQKIQDPMQVLNDPLAMRGLLLTYTEKVIKLQEQVDEQLPKVQALDRIAKTNLQNNMRDTAKILGIKPGSITGWLKAIGWITKGNGKHWYPIQTAINRGYMALKENEIEMDDGSTKVRPQAMVTNKGLGKLALRLADMDSAV